MPPKAGRSPTLPNCKKYDDCPDIIGIFPGRETWSDSELVEMRSLQLTILSDEQMNLECRYFLYGITTRMSPRAVAAAMLLTWNMRKVGPVESRSFPAEDPGVGIEDMDPEELKEDGRTYTSSHIDALCNAFPGFEARQATAFLAASTLKMFAKAASSWSLAWENKYLQNRYTEFCKKKFPFESLKPKEEEIEKMWNAYQKRMIYLGTLGRILYCLPDVEDSKQQNVLFEQHLLFTGLHIIPQFIQAKTNIVVSTAALLNALKKAGQDRQIFRLLQTLRLLGSLINDSLSKDVSPENRATWRFSRLFDPNAFRLLQTKYCRDIVAILAYVNHMSNTEATSGTSNPLGIAALREINASRLEDLEAVANKIHHHFTVTQPAEDN